jgi:hypothetical protein
MTAHATNWRRFVPDPHATPDRAAKLETVAALIWNAYKRPAYPGWPEWSEVNDVQRRACENDADVILTALEVLEASGA